MTATFATGKERVLLLLGHRKAVEESLRRGKNLAFLFEKNIGWDCTTILRPLKGRARNSFELYHANSIFTASLEIAL